MHLFAFDDSKKEGTRFLHLGTLENNNNNSNNLTYLGSSKDAYLCISRSLELA